MNINAIISFTNQVIYSISHDRKQPDHGNIEMKFLLLDEYASSFFMVKIYGGPSLSFDVLTIYC